MSPTVLIFIFGFSANLVIFFLAGLDEIYLFSHRGWRSIALGMRKLWFNKGFFLFFWVWLAWLIRRIVPAPAFFLPLFILAFLLIRALCISVTNGRRKKQQRIIAEIDRLISDPIMFIAALIAGYTDVDAQSMLIILLSLWFGVGGASLLLLSIRNRIELEKRPIILTLLISTALLSVIFIALQQAVLVQLLF